MNVSNIKKEALKLLEEGNLKGCMDYLKDRLSDESDERKELSAYLGRYNRLLKEKNLSITSREDIIRDEEKISDALKDLIHHRLKTINESLFIEPILIICNPDKRREMETFFGKKYFPNAEFINYGETLPEGVFDVIFLEDENNIVTQTVESKEEKDAKGEPKKLPTEANINRKKEMKSYLDATNAYFLYIGTFFPMNEYKNRVYYSNSRFSTYARLKEMLDYIKYYGK